MELRFEDVRVERDRRVVLEIPSLTLSGRRTTAILGPNGSGKTTLLRLIAGLERPQTGQVRFGGGSARPPIAYVFQEQVFLRRSVRDNLELGLRLRGIRDRGARVREAAGYLGVADLLDRRADLLSGGEGRRVSLARALCLRAPLVLLDEPLAGLDERTYSHLLGELPSLLAAFDATTLVVTHDRNEALRLAEDLVVLVGGRVHAVGDKRDVATNPRVAAVAEVLGYAVLSCGSERVAVPPGSLQPGPGRHDFSMQVENVVDLVDAREIVGRIDGVRVAVPMPHEGAAPAAGSRIRVHAARLYRLE